MASEKTLERKLTELTEEFGGKSFKLLSILQNGLPDRLLLLPGGRCCFVEVKTTGKKQSPMQKHVMAGIVSLGFKTYIVDLEDDLLKIRKEWLAMGLHLKTKTV